MTLICVDVFEDVLGNTYFEARGGGREELPHAPKLKARGGGQEDQPYVRRQGHQPRVPGCDGTRTAKRSYPMPEARGGGWKEQPHLQGVVAAQAQEGLEELFHVQGQKGRR